MLPVASLCALPVGVVRWRAPAPSLTVIVKATFMIGRAGRAPLAPEQGPLSLDQPSPYGDGELHRPSDFAPQKSRADLLLVGHAHPSGPDPFLPIVFRVGRHARRVYAVAGGSGVVPLVSRCLRAAPLEDGPSTRVGPTAASVDSRRLMGSLAGFDFRQFNVAPKGQQVSVLRSDATVVLEGVLEGTPRHEITLPGLTPCVYYVAGGHAPTSPVAVPLTCDTLWVDADARLCSLTWRGVIEVADPVADGAFLTASLCAQGEQHGWPEIESQLDDAPWYRAVEASDDDLTPRRVPAPSIAPAPSFDPASFDAVPSAAFEGRSSFERAAPRAPISVAPLPAASLWGPSGEAAPPSGESYSMWQHAPVRPAAPRHARGSAPERGGPLSASERVTHPVFDRVPGSSEVRGTRGAVGRWHPVSAGAGSVLPAPVAQPPGKDLLVTQRSDEDSSPLPLCRPGVLAEDDDDLRATRHRDSGAGAGSRPGPPGVSADVQATQYATLSAPDDLQATQYAALPAPDDLQATQYAAVPAPDDLQATQYAALSAPDDLQATQYAALSAPDELQATRFADSGVARDAALGDLKSTQLVERSGAPSVTQPDLLLAGSNRPAPPSVPVHRAQPPPGQARPEHAIPPPGRPPPSRPPARAGRTRTGTTELAPEAGDDLWATAQRPSDGGRSRR